MDFIATTKANLEAAFLRWELDYRAGLTASIAETAARPAEDVARDNAAHLLTFLHAGGA